MDNQKLRWGLLSTAAINKAIIPGLKSSDLNELYGVASRTKERAEEYAREIEIAHAYGSYEEMLSDSAIDVVYISLPNHMHAEWARKAAQHGKHVLCEKPIALTRDEVESMITTAEENNTILMEAFMYRHHPRTMKVLELIKEGLIGEVQYIRGTYTYILTRPENYRWFPEYGGGGLWDVGCYPVSYTLMVMGLSPVQVFGCQRVGPTGIDEFFTGELLFDGGVVAQFDCGTNLELNTSMEIRGSQGSLLIAHPFNTRNNHIPIIYRSGDHQVEYSFADINGFQAQTENMAEAIRGNAQPNISLQESRVINHTLVSLLLSAQTNLPVNLER